MLARTLLAGIQESAEAARVAEEERQQMLANEPVAYDFSDEATLESYWIGEAILEAFEGILHIDKVFHVADIKGEVQAFTENAEPEEVEAMLEGIINGSISRVVETLSVLVSKVKAWFDKLIKYVTAMFATGAKFVEKAESTINAKYNDKAKYGSYKYTSYKYNFGVAEALVKTIRDQIKQATDATKPAPAQIPAADKDLPEEAQKAEVAADVATAAKPEGAAPSEEKDTKESVEVESETLEVVTESVEETVSSEEVELMAEASDISDAMESMLETLDDGVMESYMSEIVEESVDPEDEETEVTEGYDMFDFDAVSEMFTLDYILESAKATSQVSELCSKLSKGKAKSIAELKKYYTLSVHCGEEKRAWHTFFDDAKPSVMMKFIKNGKEKSKEITTNMNEYVSDMNKLISRLEAVSKKALSEKNDTTYQATSSIASTLTVLSDIYQAIVMEKVRLYKEAISEYTRILKGFILYKGDSSKAATTSDETTAAKDATQEGVEHKETKDMSSSEAPAANGNAEKDASSDTDTAVADAEKTVDDAAAAADADTKEADKVDTAKEAAEVAEEACGGGKCKKSTEEACNGKGGCKKPAEEACGGKKACKEEDGVADDTETEPVKESVSDEMLSLFDQAFNYI